MPKEERKILTQDEKSKLLKNIKFVIYVLKL